VKATQVANDIIGQLIFVSALQRGLAAGLEKEDIFPPSGGQARALSQIEALLELRDHRAANPSAGPLAVIPKFEVSAR
jgi:hypothetical protein